ncbi:MAG: two-component regulator propeller domain-containing protein [Bacteroidales bacterium]
MTTTAWISYPSTNGVSVQAIAIDAMNNKWFCTYGDGILKFDRTNWTTYTNNGLINGASFMAIDAQGNKWFGTDNGVFKFDGTNWEHYSSSNSSLKGAYYPAIAIDEQHNIWFGTMSGIGGISELRSN